MIKGITYSKKLSFLCAAGLGTTCAMAWLRYHVAGEWIEQRRRAADLENDLIKQVTAMSDFEDSKLSALRVKVSKFKNRLGAEDLWERLVLHLGSGWSAESGPKDEKAGYSVQTGTFELLKPSISDWPAIVDAVRAAEQLPGVGIVRFEMRSSGNREHRTVDTVRIVVAIQSRLPGADR